MPFEKSLASIRAFRRYCQKSPSVRRAIALDRCIHTLTDAGVNGQSIHTASEVFTHWGDPLDDAGKLFLRSCLLEFDTGRGSVLVAGASALPLVLGAAGNAMEHKRNVWCFDQDTHWVHVLRTWLEQFSIKNTFLISAAPVLLQHMVRYRIDTRRLPSDFGLVVCEGSRGSPRNPLSTLQHFGNHLAPSFTLLARKINVEKDSPILMQWARDHGATFVIINKKEGFVKISRRAVASLPDDQPQRVEINQSTPLAVASHAVGLS